MKKIVYYIAVAFLAINFSSCSDFLDLPFKKHGTNLNLKIFPYIMKRPLRTIDT